MVKCRVPVADWCVITTSGQLVGIREIIFDQQAFDLERILRVFACRTEFTEYTERFTEGCAQVHHRLADYESVFVTAVLGNITDVSESHQPELGR